MVLVCKLRKGCHKNELPFSGRVEHSAAIYFNTSGFFQNVTCAEPHTQKELSGLVRYIELLKNKAGFSSENFWMTL